MPRQSRRAYLGLLGITAGTLGSAGCIGPDESTTATGAGPVQSTGAGTGTAQGTETASNEFAVEDADEPQAGRWVMPNVAPQQTSYHPNAQGPTETIQEQWTLEITDAYTAPVVADDTVFAGTQDARVLARATADGSERWSRRLGGDRVTGVVVSGERVVAVLEDGLVAALDMATGEQGWETELDASTRTRPGPVTDDTVYVRTNRVLYALNADDGSLRWSRDRTHGAAVAGQYVVAQYNSDFHILDPADGTERWVLEWPLTISVGPVVADDTIYVGCNGPGRVYAVDPTDGSELWAHDMETGVASLAVADGTVVAAGNGQDAAALTALDGADGTVEWSHDMENGFRQTLVVDDTVYASMYGAIKTYALSDGAVQWTSELSAGTFVAIADGVIYSAGADGITAMSVDG